MIIKCNDNNKGLMLEVFYTLIVILMGLLNMFSILLLFVIISVHDYLGWGVFCGGLDVMGCSILMSFRFIVCVRVGGVRHLSLVLVCS